MRVVLSARVDEGCRVGYMSVGCGGLEQSAIKCGEHDAGACREGEEEEYLEVFDVYCTQGVNRRALPVAQLRATRR